MGISPTTADLLAILREWAADPGAVIFPINTQRRSIALFPADVIGRTDQELQAFIAKRLNE